MSAAALLRDLERHGASVWLSGDSLRLSVPPGSRLPTSMVEAARAAKAELAAILAIVSTNCRMDLAEPEERAAIVEHDGGIPSIYADEFARLQQWCPAGVPEARWREFVNDGGVFLDRRGDEALRLGWQPSDLFGLDPVTPMARYDRMGLLWLLHGQTVSALRTTEAALSGGHVYRRKQAVHPTPMTTMQTR